MSDVRIHTIWIQWDDGIELRGAVDEYTHDENPDALQRIIAEAVAASGRPVRRLDLFVPGEALDELFSVPTASTRIAEESETPSATTNHQGD